MIETHNQYLADDDIWVIVDNAAAISETGSPAPIMADGEAIQPVREYRISELGHYLLNPNPIMIRKKLIGFECFYPQPAGNAFKKKIRRLLPKKLHRSFQDRQTPSRVVTGNAPPDLACLTDSKLKTHISGIYDQLRHHEPVLKELAALGFDQITDINGICLDNDGGTSPLVLRGNLAEKRNYISEYLYREVDVLLNHGAYSADGLFKLGGFNFRQFQPHVQYRLVKYYHKGRSAYLVADNNGGVDFAVETPKLVKYLHLLEKCLRSNRELRTAVKTCARGGATPLHLFFNTRIDMTYTEQHIPGLYRELLSAGDYEIEEDIKTRLMDSLNHRNIRVVFSYRPEDAPRHADYLAAITVMHDIKALEPLKDNIPALYTAIRENALTSEAGRFYLLETLHGRHTED
ncbi:MAG: hypothetical protein SWH68_07540 [Thermodesulfobacteriota bacterium]|nr:hypothetical protein [Thermodesulfobacteriota bacterium]